MMTNLETAARGALAALSQNKTYPADVEAAKSFLRWGLGEGEGMELRQVARWLRRYDDTTDHYPCRYGHHDCSIAPKGYCFNEMEAAFDAREDAPSITKRLEVEYQLEDGSWIPVGLLELR